MCGITGRDQAKLHNYPINLQTKKRNGFSGPLPSYVLGLNSPKQVSQQTRFSLKRAFLHSHTDLIEQNLRSRPDGLGKKTSYRRKMRCAGNILD